MNTQAQSRLSPQGYQNAINRVVGARREPSRGYAGRMTPEGYDRTIARLSSRPSMNLADSVATGYNGVKTVVVDSGRLVGGVVGGVYNAGARVVKGVAVGAANVIGTTWNAGTGVYNFVSQARAAREQAKIQEMNGYLAIAKNGLELAAMSQQLKATRKKKNQPQAQADIEATFRAFATMGITNPFDIASAFAQWYAANAAPRNP